MKRLLLSLVFCLCASLAGAADLTSSVNTENYQIYNKAYRDVKDGTNALTADVVTANTYGVTNGSTTIKTSAGYLDNITFTPCQSPYFVGDSSFTSNVNGYLAAGFATIISTVVASGSATNQFNIPFHLRFSNGLSIATAVSSCTATASYR